MRQQLVCGQIAWLTAVEDSFGDVRGEIAGTDEPREIGRAHPLPLGQCGKWHNLDEARVALAKAIELKPGGYLARTISYPTLLGDRPSVPDAPSEDLRRVATQHRFS